MSDYSVTFHIGSRYIVNRKAIRNTVKDSFLKQGIKQAAVDISVVGTRKMAHLNTLRDKVGPTNVLSFTQRDPSEQKIFPTPVGQLPHYGDIVLCYPVLVLEAVKKNKLVDELINYYIDHSIYHLLGKHFQE